ncbi:MULTISPECIES: hypothetical protein [unclassified Bacillus (in: firmicutes)]|uniref:hypothetical protein n=1 Tax=unclassified Bacillus (in: firmicutes) TaxID=185979 RepID=UPI0008F38BD0|nr:MULTISPECIES: hypothetical protein [unclassified Bacillus (in: firmicutes)]SFA85880.1 hypothetical protein SAMN02799634_10268 [Bacillus sp. UNCCL13]SFQ83540.1 hypothetical protein SAMN04488577_2187 [Bacillus sp. cl95]
MKKNYTVAFVMLFVASITSGFALKNVFDYSMIVGFGLGIVFLLCSVFFAGRSQKDSKAQ